MDRLSGLNWNAVPMSVLLLSYGKQLKQYFKQWLDGFKYSLF